MLFAIHIMLLGGFAAWLTNGMVSNIAFLVLLIGFAVGALGFMRHD